MNAEFEGLSFDPPFEVDRASATTTLVSTVGGAKDPRALRSVDPVRPNVVVDRRRLAKGATLEALAAICRREVSEAVESYRVVSADPLRFADGVEGLAVCYELRAGPYLLLQTQAVRVDGDTGTTLTITSSAAVPNEQRSRFFNSLRSMRIDGRNRR